MTPTQYELASTLLPGIGSKLSKTLISYCGSAEAVFTSSVSAIRKIPGIGEKSVATIAANRDTALRESEKILKACERKGIEVLHYTNERYPARLKQVADAPPIIYIRGNSSLNQPKAVAIVGTRKATEYGKRVTEEIVEQLRPHEPVIISGLAYGIDITAHKAALKHGLPTFGILAGGLDSIYPAVHKDIAMKMLDQGALISENKPGTTPDFHLFPERNRIIAGMADVVIVVEAAAKGGALITADIAYGYEKMLFAVPGDIGKDYSIGCNHLIKSQKANIYTGISDLEYLMHWEKGAQPQKVPKISLEAFETKEQPIVKVLLAHKDGILIDELSWKSQVSMNEAASILLNLEFQGIVKSLPGKRYKLKVR